MSDIDWSQYEEVGGNRNSEVTRYWPDRKEPLKVNDCVKGELTSKVPKKDDKSAYYLLEKDGEITLVWGSTVLDRKFESVPLGSKVAIQYLGEKPSEKRRGKMYKDFRVGILADFT